MTSQHRPKTVAVAGATGLVGAQVVRRLEERGARVVPMARSLGVDLMTGRGVGESLPGADALIDVSNVLTQNEAVAVERFTRMARTLVDGCRQHGVGRYVLLSIIGVDEIEFGYYKGKRAQESVIEGSGLEYSILRATQFHEFAEQMLGRMRVGPIALVPRMTSAPVASREVADRLVELALADEVPHRLELAGPDTMTVPEMAREFCRATGRRLLRVPVPVPGPGGRRMAEGGLLPRGPHEVGVQTYREWLVERSLDATPPA
ncbi:SDR family oxidoreductase [Ruicaihuangia caeni]|uniref:NAD(P)H-binding protein n=1 Tax=Ruicaihuangia caeni TaxID=3042517 RepID=A0AAW6T8J1_9MICO|nr:NAD(P)H-binding protein [Klugiella sp. YN-L-19]MDI2097457.1 NAD(P)H-binding protein [Klugiella sp. YN-L-19]